MRRGTAAEPAGVPVSRPGPRRAESVGICPLPSGEASWRPTRPPRSFACAGTASSGATSTVVKSDSLRLAPAGSSRAATRTVTRSADAGVSCWTANPAARHRSRAIQSRRFRESHALGVRRGCWRGVGGPSRLNVGRARPGEGRRYCMGSRNGSRSAVPAERSARARRALREVGGMPPR